MWLDTSSRLIQNADPDGLNIKGPILKSHRHPNWIPITLKLKKRAFTGYEKAQLAAQCFKTYETCPLGFPSLVTLLRKISGRNEGSMVLHFKIQIKKSNDTSECRNGECWMLGASLFKADMVSPLGFTTGTRKRHKKLRLPRQQGLVATLHSITSSFSRIRQSEPRWHSPGPPPCSKYCRRIKNIKVVIESATITTNASWMFTWSPSLRFVVGYSFSYIKMCCIF